MTFQDFLFPMATNVSCTLWTLRYVAPEQVPVQYGGLSREGEQEFSIEDPVTQVAIKAATKHIVEFPISEVRTRGKGFEMYFNFIRSSFYFDFSAGFFVTDLLLKDDI